jgi:hypothetical protein
MRIEIDDIAVVELRLGSARAACTEIDGPPSTELQGTTASVIAATAPGAAIATEGSVSKTIAGSSQWMG